MAGLLDLPFVKELPKVPFPARPGAVVRPEINPVRPKVPGSKDRNRIDPDRPFRAPTLLKV